MTLGKPDCDNAAEAAEKPVFDATITPHRSLGQDGFRIVMTLVCLTSVAASIPFMVLGAWPVAGFFGLDIIAIFIAFKVNFNAARAFERIVVTPLEVLLRKVSHHGREKIWRSNPAWTKLEREDDEDYGLLELSLVSRGQRTVVASALSPGEREGFAQALGTALAKAKRGPDFEPA
ncbi:Uncharacterized membrane protein [Bosea sp. 62]|uniref:DUF2244 domain-containing protein n=1 Tax=unclassified Bosea (in: a-proteobacteria) TaxID=2653178 RepID=UPI001250D4A3|nr:MULTISPECIES: DUF2244 domain-containing protein [unclassified Bosea (in: a-proteobacteria)]CAD5295289.1 Uncharacterized membrane protein [Bosea sp. 21B]CAD5295666.1 Uncharacterized membrane protein [Bosea sp. 46]CAD5298225.1 Uncharacterized membrane protein [Bosea sp. 7B]VVT60979.1 Uncharacterized membrane protein [Bosea sp. EC-HK365B]VXB34063.1 Uncharacterized membrane protein [Bosea sp. 127]